MSKDSSSALPESGTNNAAGQAATSRTAASIAEGHPETPAPAAPTGETLRFGLDGPQPVELGDCRPYLKDGETVAECIARNRKDADMLLGELAKERLKREELQDSAQRMVDAVGAHDNQNMPWSVVRSARENLLSALKGLPTTPVSATRTPTVEAIKASIQCHVPLPGWAYEDEIVRVVRDFIPSTTGALQEGYYLATFKEGRSAKGRMMWWGPNSCGYTPYLEGAGIYTKAEAEKIANEYTVAVPVAMLTPHESRLVDPGHDRNRAFWTADDLRAFVSATQESKK